MLTLTLPGSFGRTTAKININGKIYTKLYSAEERTLLRLELWVRVKDRVRVNNLNLLM
jgi:predicted AlkP superfamily phosphohydrolase/phosphomutase